MVLSYNIRARAFCGNCSHNIHLKVPEDIINLSTLKLIEDLLNIVNRNIAYEDVLGLCYRGNNNLDNVINRVFSRRFCVASDDDDSLYKVYKVFYLNKFRDRYILLRLEVLGYKSYKNIRDELLGYCRGSNLFVRVEDLDLGVR
jgi:hypothetical protein